MKLTNASFHLADVHALPASVGTVDVIVISRLFLVVPNRDAVMQEVFRVLRPGGKCFVAEPVSSARTQFPLSAMWLASEAHLVRQGAVCRATPRHHHERKASSMIWCIPSHGARCIWSAPAATSMPFAPSRQQRSRASILRGSEPLPENVAGPSQYSLLDPAVKQQRLPACVRLP